ncbi:alpha/beta fold hydrolase [Mycoplasmopsis opalescens]|uniref:alpha/beta fold hydrolase n=1 Tax=Mycoplasmopsis opalescens TaxID=114886 RepID=UPI0004A75CE3|nr:alpha/beta hydrolase [Mycoplasmopsis opalescens]
MFKKKIEINGEIINYIGEFENSNLPILLFFHGFGDDSQRALSLFPIKRNFQIFAIDFPGCGESSNITKTPMLQHFQETASLFIQEVFKDKNIYIMTHSMGLYSGLYCNKTLKNIKHIFLVAPPLTIKVLNDEEKQMVINIMLPKDGLSFLKTYELLFSEEERKSSFSSETKNRLLNTPKIFFEERSRKFSRMLTTELMDSVKVSKFMQKYLKNTSNCTVFLSKQDNFTNYSEDIHLLKKYKIDFIELNDLGHAMFYKGAARICKFVNFMIIKKEGMY